MVRRLAVLRSIILNLIFCFCLLHVLVHCSYASLNVPDSAPLVLCYGQTGTVDIVLENPLNHSLDVRMSKVSVPSDLQVDFFYDTISIASGESKRIPVFVTAHTSNYGEKSFVLSFSSEDFSVSKSFDIFLKNCHQVSVSADSLSKDVCLFTSEEFEVTLFNSGMYDEHLSLSLSGNGAGYAKLSREGDNVLELRQNESRSVYLFVYPSEKVGNFSLIIDIFNEYTQKTVPLNINVESCSDFTVEMPSYVGVCENSQAVVPVNVSNTGISSDQYSVFLSGPPGLILSNSSFKIDSGRSIILNVTVPPECEEHGTYYANLTFSGVNSFKSVNEQLKIIVDDCYNFNIDFNEPPKVCSCDSVQFNLTLYNSGSSVQEYYISENSELISFLRNNLTLNSGEFASVPFIFSSCEVGEYSIPLVVTDNSSCITKKVKYFNIEAIGEGDCFRAIILPSQKLYPLNSLSQYNIPVSVRNLGIKNASYHFEFSGSAGSWVYAVSDVNLNISSMNTGLFNVLVVPPDNLSSDSFELVINAFVNNNLVGSDSVSFEKERDVSVPQVVSYASKKVPFEWFYFILVLIISPLLLFLVLRKSLGTFLKR